MAVVDTILELFRLDSSALITDMFHLLSATIVMTTIAGKFPELIGKPVRWLKGEQENHGLLIQTAKNLDALQQRHEEDAHQSICHNDMVREDPKKPTDMFIDREINDLRWEIIKLFITIIEGRLCSKDSYKHRIRTYEKHEKLLADDDMENGEMELSMGLIQEPYKEKLKNGF